MRQQGIEQGAQTAGKVPAGYKKTPLGIIPEDWTTPELRTILQERKRRNRDLSFGKEAVLSVSGEKGVTNQIELLGRSYAGATVADYRIVEHNDIVYTKSPLKENPYGIIKQNKGCRGIVSPLYAVYESSSELMSAYLDYWFSSAARLNNYLRPLVRKGPKNTLLIDDSEVLRGTIVVPTDLEIERIVTVLSSCDRIIEGKQKLLDTKKSRKRALMRMLLDSESAPDRRIVSSMEYRNVRIGKLGTVTTGKTPDTTIPENFGDGVPFITPGDFGDSPFIRRTERYLSSMGTSASRLLPPNTIYVVCIGATVGKTGICNMSATCNQQVNAIQVLPDFNDLFVYYSVTYHFNRAKVRLVGAETLPLVNKTDFSSIEIPVPSIYEQHRIASILSSADREIDGLAREIDAWKKKRKALSQLLLSGKVRV